MYINSLALEWLRGEDSYQHEKFSHETNTAYLCDGVIEGVWGNQFYGNYINKLRLYEQEGLRLHALQAAGKIAATARGLYVSIRALKSPVDVWSEENEASFRRIAMFPDFHTQDFDYRTINDINGTPLDESLRALHNSLPRPFNTALLAEEIDILSSDVMREGFYLFCGKIAAHSTIADYWSLSQPGLPSGEVVPWRPMVG